MTESSETNEPCATVAQAVRAGRLDDVKKLVKDGHPVDGQDNRGWRPLHEAAAANLLDILHFLFEQEGTDVDWQGFDGCTPLLLAAQHGHLDALRALLDHKADPNLADNMQISPLFAAVKGDYVDCVKSLAEKGASVNSQQYSGVTPLHQAVSTGKVELVTYLLEKGARLDLREEYNITPIFSAAQFGSNRCLEILLKTAQERGEEQLVNECAEDGASPLFLAAQEGHAACVRMLLHHGADANLPTKDPTALPLHAAMQFTRLSCLDALLSPTDQKLLTRCDPHLWDLATRDREGLVIRRLIKSGLNINVRLPLRSSDAFTPRVFSHFGSIKFSQRISAIAAVAHFKNPIACAEILLNSGAYVDCSSGHKVPPLLPAINNKCTGLTELLIAYGACVNVYHPQVSGNLCLILALPWWHGLKLLLKCGAEVSSLFKRPKLEYKSAIIGANDQAEETSEGEVTEPESSDDESEPSPEAPLSPSRKRKRRHKPMSFVHTLRASSYSIKGFGTYLGKVLFLLLQFACNVSISPDLESLLDSKEEWKALVTLMENPRSLKHYCRAVIRSRLGSRNLLKEDPVREIKLPAALSDFVLYADLE